MPRGYAIHLGSTGCTPNEVKTAPRHSAARRTARSSNCRIRSRTDFVIADLAALLKDSNIDTNQEKTAAGCMSSPDDGDCAPLFANLGLPFAGKPAGKQTFFRKGARPDPQLRRRRETRRGHAGTAGLSVFRAPWPAMPTMRMVTPPRHPKRGC